MSDQINILIVPTTAEMYEIDLVCHILYYFIDTVSKFNTQFIGLCIENYTFSKSVYFGEGIWLIREERR